MDEQSNDIVPVTATVNLPDMGEMAEYARELACGRYNDQEFQKVKNLSDEQFKALKDNKFFQECFKIAITEWASIKSTAQRLKLKAQWGLEDSLPDIIARVTDNKEPLSSVASVMKNLTDMGGVGGEKQQAANTERVQITINLGADQIKIDKAREPIEIDGTVELQPLPQGTATDEPVQSLPKPS